MNTVEKKIQYQLQIWTLIGPTVVFLALFIILLKTSPMTLPLCLIALMGLTICWKWRLKGGGVSVALLALIFLFYFPNVSSQQQLWHVGIGASLILAFFVIALSRDEAEMVLDNLSKELTASGDAQGQRELEKQNMEMEIVALSQKTLAQEAELKSSRQIVENARKSLAEMQVRRESLSKELLEKNQKIEFLEANAGLSVHAKDPVDDSELSYLKEVIKKQEQEVFNLQFRLDSAYEDVRIAHQQIKDNEKELIDARELSQLQAEFSTQTQDEQVVQEKIINEFREELDVLKSEKERLEYEKRMLEASLQQKTLFSDNLKQSFQEKNQLVKNLEISLQQKSLFAEDIEHSLQEKSKLIKNLELSLLEQSQFVKSLEAALQQKTAFVENIERLLQERNTIIDNLERTVLEKTLLVENMGCSLQEKNTLMDNLEHAVLEKTALVEALENSVQEKTFLGDQLAELKLSFEKLSQEKNVLSQELESVLNNEAPKTDLVAYRFGKMYAQLKEQFAEKSAILDETRRDLFRTEEKLLSLQKDKEELELYNKTELEEKLESYTLKLITEISEMQAQYQKEIDALELVVSNLVH